MKKPTIAIISAGQLAQRQHLSNMTVSKEVFLKTVCDIDKEKLKKAQDMYEVPNATTDFDEVLSDDQIDVVLIATKEDVQAELTIKALEAGKDVYVEKPLANEVEDFHKVLEVQKRSGKQVAIGFNRRFSPAYRKVKEILQASGGAKNIHYRIADEYWRWGAHYPPGVRVIHEICHIFDIIRWFTDSDVESVYCVESRSDDEVIVLKMKSGCVVSIMNSGYVHMDLPKERLEIITEMGAVTVEDFVELRTYGLKDFEHKYTFAGHRHVNQDMLLGAIMKKTGAEGWQQIRRVGWEMRNIAQQEPSENDTSMIAQIRKYYENGWPETWNYMVEKGWQYSVESFAKNVVAGKKSENANVTDGLKVNILAHAAIESRQTGKSVLIND